mgnify:FL=1
MFIATLHDANFVRSNDFRVNLSIAKKVRQRILYRELVPVYPDQNVEHLAHVVDAVGNR